MFSGKVINICGTVSLKQLYDLDDQDSIPERGAHFFLLQHVQPDSRTDPVYYSVGIKGSFKGLKRPEPEADH
jgi:hypothetical protein